MKRENKALRHEKPGVTPKEKELSNLDWEVDIIQKTRVSERRAWLITKGLFIVVILLTAGFVMLLPLKKVVPHIVMVDKLTGEASIAQTQQKFMADNELNDKHWVKEFVTARERYNYRLLQHDFDTVKRLAGDEPWKDYSELYLGRNPLDEQFGENIVITPKILSITLSNNDFATVRYELQHQDRRTKAAPKIVRRIATMRYEYKPQFNVPESVAIENPLGFSVTDYQTDAEFTGGK